MTDHFDSARLRALRLYVLQLRILWKKKPTPKKQGEGCFVQEVAFAHEQRSYLLSNRWCEKTNDISCGLVMKADQSTIELYFDSWRGDVRLLRGNDRFFSTQNRCSKQQRRTGMAFLKLFHKDLKAHLETLKKTK